MPKFLLHPKVAGATFAGALTILLLWVLNTYLSVTPPVEVQEAIEVLVSLLAGYLIPSDGGVKPATSTGEPQTGTPPVA